ncbi:MAG: AAA family ATPase [Alphaproteobacteria bacterium]|nr:AAA family ATPase [Alphaproteobacteria bacterium]
MQIERLTMTNFKGFIECSLNFDAEFNLLVGENGAGKTSVLDALSVAAGSWLLGLRGYDTRHIRPSDVRLAARRYDGEIRFEEQFPVEVRAAGCVAGRRIEWARRLNIPGGRTTFGDAAEIKSAASKADAAVREGHTTTLPLISYYGTGRLWMEPKDVKRESSVKSPDRLESQRKLSRLEGYRNSVDPRLSVRDIVEWIARQSWASYQQGRDTPVFSAVKKAVLGCVDGAEDVYFDPSRGEVILDIRRQGAQPFVNLSDGQRVIFGMVGDLAQKAAKLNPHLGDEALNLTPGVVFIDELDLHLHPKWQRRVVGDLRRTFPRIQFFATTHSPQIIGEVLPRQVILLSRSTPPETASESLGRDSGWILRHLMDASDRTRDLADELKKAEALIDSAEFEDARRLINLLRERYGSDPALVDMEAAIARWELER